MFRSVVLCAVVLVASTAATNFRICTKNRPFPLAVDIVDCPEMPCNAYKGATAVMNVHFIGTRDNIKSMTAQVKATALGINTTYELPEDVADVCSNLLDGAVCPIDKGEDVVYGFNFYVESYYPEITVKVEVSLVDEAKQTVACFVVDIKVKKGNTVQLL